LIYSGAILMPRKEKRKLTISLVFESRLIQKFTVLKPRQAGVPRRLAIISFEVMPQLLAYTLI
jgi:hypothetical protein